MARPDFLQPLPRSPAGSSGRRALLVRPSAIVVIFVVAFVAALGLAQSLCAWIERPAILLAGWLPAALLPRRVKTRRPEVFL